MADLVEDRTLEQIGSGDGFAADRPGPLLPGQPVADLRVGGEQQHIAVGQFDRQHQAGIVGQAVELQREFRRARQPIGVDAPPRIRCGALRLPVVLSEEVHLPGKAEGNLILLIEGAARVVRIEGGGGAAQEHRQVRKRDAIGLRLAF